MSNYLFIFGVNGFNVGERLCYNRSSFLRLPFNVPYMPVFFFYDVFNLLRSSSFNTCLRLSHVNRIHMLLLYLFCTTTLYYINPSVTSLTVVYIRFSAGSTFRTFGTL